MRNWRQALTLTMVVLTMGCVNPHSKKIRYQIRPEYSVEDPQFLRSIGQLLGPQIVPGNRATALQNGEEIFPAMLEAIRGARKTIDFETYIYWSGAIGQEFADALAERARAGVKIHILLDWLGAKKISNAYVQAMKAAGVEVEVYRPLHWYSPFRINHRTHRKLLIVDGKIGFTGGAGIADIWQGAGDSPNHWRDSHFRLEGPAVAQMQAAFMDNWLKTKAEVLHGKDYFPELKKAGDDLAQVFQSSPREGSESVELMYLLSIAAAKKNIRLGAAYFVPHKVSIEALLSARKRGVEVEIIVPGNYSDVKLVRHASRSSWGRLLQAGVRIYEFGPTMYHCKVMIVDDVWVSVGSANFDARSFRLNDEANLNIFSRPFAAQQIATFEMDKAQSTEVKFEKWRRRSNWKRFKETFANLFRPQL